MFLMTGSPQRSNTGNFRARDEYPLCGECHYFTRRGLQSKPQPPPTPRGFGEARGSLLPHAVCVLEAKLGAFGVAVLSTEQGFAEGAVTPLIPRRFPRAVGSSQRFPSGRQVAGFDFAEWSGQLARHFHRVWWPERYFEIYQIQIPDGLDDELGSGEGDEPLHGSPRKPCRDSPLCFATRDSRHRFVGTLGPILRSPMDPRGRRGPLPQSFRAGPGPMTSPSRAPGLGSARFGRFRSRSGQPRSARFLSWGRLRPRKSRGRSRSPIPARRSWGRSVGTDIPIRTAGAAPATFLGRSRREDPASAWP